MDKNKTTSNQIPIGNKWRNITLIIVLTISIIYFGYSFIFGQVCNNLAMDYCAFYSTGKMINQHGFKAVYDIDQLTEFQREFFNVEDNQPYEAFGMPYLPVFLLPFSFLSYINLPYSYYIWTALNLSVFIVYLFFFIRKIGQSKFPLLLIFIFIFSTPFIMNLGEGQYNIWLAICAGEFIRSINSKSPIKAGLWLGGWLLKPQLLILIIPLLILRRNFKVIKGFLISSLFVLIISFILIGPYGFINQMNVILQSAGGGVQSYPQKMINWRMIGVYLSSISTNSFGNWVVIIGSLITVAATFYIFRKLNTKKITEYSIALMGIFAATLLATWHSHLYMAIVLYPIMIFLLIKGQLKFDFLLIWIYTPILLQFAFMIISIFFPIYNQSTQNLIYAVTFFALNMLLLIWSFVMYNKTETNHAEIHLNQDNNSVEF